MKRQVRVVAGFLAVCLLALASAFGIASGEKIKSRGVITNRLGDTLTVKSADGDYTVLLNSDTRVQRPAGVIGVRKTQVSSDVLIPGLKMSFEGVGDEQNRVVAKTITFESDDLALAQVIQAGLNPVAQQQAKNIQNIESTQQRTAANEAAIAAHQREIDATKQRISANEQGIQEVADSTQKRFSDLATWYVKGETTVNFGVGDSALSEDAQKSIADFAGQAHTYTGFVIEVRGYADSTGRLEDNQQLSKERAQAVVAYLLQDCHLQVKNVVAPGAMGEKNPAASNETAGGRAENRRVDLRLLVNKGVSGE
jgi:outer membrane protein OmpA-like peptidoglycan-associated protein